MASESKFPKASKRSKISIFIFTIFCFISFFLYAGYIATYWALNAEPFQWILIVDMTLAGLLLMTSILGLISIFTCAVPLVRMIFAVMYCTTLFCCIGSFTIGVLVLRPKMNFKLQTGGASVNPAIQLALYITVLCSVVLCAIPCFFCSAFQVLVAYGLFREQNDLEPGCLPHTVVNLVVVSCEAIETLTQDTWEQTCKKDRQRLK
eukprot:gene5912-9742_t